MSVHKEISFETEICDHLEKHGWLYEGGDAAKYERDKALFSPDVLAWVRRCLQRLPERLRTLFTLREMDDLPVPEAAAAAGVTPGSAAVLLTRARHQLRACLQHHDVTP